MKSSTMDLITANQEIFNRLIYKAITDQEYMKSTALSLTVAPEYGTPVPKGKFLHVMFLQFPRTFSSWAQLLTQEVSFPIMTWP